jgi:hypothetical protein
VTTSRVVRWTVPVDDQPHVLPLSGAVLHVASRQAGEVDLWTRDSGGPTIDRTFQVVGTYHPYPSDWTHVGTAVTASGAFVWHLMELP